MVVRETGRFPGKDGVEIFWRRWLPEDTTPPSRRGGRPRMAMLLVPGAAEHSGRYHHVAHHFVRHGFLVYALDHRGYGRSGGRRGHVEHFSDYLDDLHSYVEMVTEHANQKPVMVGHSMGGLIALSYALEHGEAISRLVLSSPSLGLLGWQRRAVPVAAPLLRLLPQRWAAPARIDPRRVSRRRWTWSAYAVDPLICRVATPRWTREFLAQLRRVERTVTGLAVPSLWLQAEQDSLVDPQATYERFAQVRSAAKQFRWYPARHHEIFNDPGREEVFADILNWLDQAPTPEDPPKKAGG